MKSKHSYFRDIANMMHGCLLLFLTSVAVTPAQANLISPALKAGRKLFVKNADEIGEAAVKNADDIGRGAARNADQAVGHSAGDAAESTIRGVSKAGRLSTGMDTMLEASKKSAQMRAKAAKPIVEVPEAKSISRPGSLKRGVENGSAGALPVAASSLPVAASSLPIAAYGKAVESRERGEGYGDALRNNPELVTHISHEEAGRLTSLGKTVIAWGAGIVAVLLLIQLFPGFLRKMLDLKSVSSGGSKGKARGSRSSDTAEMDENEKR